MVYGRIMSLIWNIFHFLRIIPKPGSGCINKIALTMWLLLFITTGFLICFYDLYITDGYTYTLSELITYLLNDILIPLESLIVIKELASLGELQTTTFSLNPRCSFYFLLITIIHFISLLIVLYFMTLDFPMYDDWYFVVTGIQYLAYFLLMTATRLVIGAAVNKLCTSIVEGLPTVGFENIQITIAPMILEYQTLKTKLSFLLFTTFTADVILMTAYGYYIAKYSAYSYILFFCYIIFNLSYIAFVLDDCYSTLKSALPTCRCRHLVQIKNSAL